jgi:tight adherence protein B
MEPLVIGLVVVGVLAIAALILALFGGEARETSIEERLDQFVADRMPELTDQEIEEEAKRLSRLTEGLNRAIERRTFGASIATQLAQASIKLTVTEYLVLWAVSIVVVTGIAYLIFRNYMAISGFAIGFFLPRVLVNATRGRRLRRFNDQLGDAINLIVNSLKAGYSMPIAMETVANNLPPPISEEFRRVVIEIGLGISLDAALNNMLRRVRSQDLDLLITAVGVQHEVGGNLAEILDTISTTIRERVRIQGEIKTLTAQGEFTGYLLSSLPFILTLVITAMSRDYMEPMFTTPCGWIMLGVAFIIIVLGFIIIRRIIKIDI